MPKIYRYKIVQTEEVYISKKDNFLQFLDKRKMLIS